MKTKSEKLKGIIRVIYTVFPFFVGMYYYIPYYFDLGTRYPNLDALYSSLKIYSGVMESGMTLTLLLHIARFMGLAVTLSIIVNALNRLSDIINWFKLRSSKSFVIYGNTTYTSILADDIGNRFAVRAEDNRVPAAKNYVLMFPTDRENLDFYAENFDKLRDRNVTIVLEDIERQSIKNRNVNVFSYSECAARNYWKEHYPKASEKIAVIGFGRTGQNILTFGLQMNIISPDQHFEYHVWGNSSEFIKLHPYLDQMEPDEIIFHDGKWWDDPELLDSFDRIILCDDENENLTVLSKLFSSGRDHCNIHIRISNREVVERMFGDAENIKCFGTADEIVSKENIINSRTVEAAKAQHEFYANKYGGASWEELNAFTRYSNISSVDFKAVIKRLHGEGVPVEVLANLEHIRWCRYHLLNNWKYGSVRNNAKRIHNCLVSYSELSEEDKNKDIEAIRTII